MSTKATGDGRTDAVGAVEADVAAEGAEPSAAVVAELEDAEPEDAEPAVSVPTAWDTGASSAWGIPRQADPESTGGADSTADADSDAAAALVPGQAAPDDAAPGDPPAADAAPDEASVSAEELATGEATQADDAPSGNESAEAGETSETDDAAASVEAEEDEDEDEEADEASEDDETPEDEEDYDEYGDYEAEEVAEPRRARRWPRLLLALGFFVLGAAIVGGAVAIVGSVTHGFKKPVKVTYTKSALFSLKTGDCFDPKGQSYTLISCDSPHVAEVFATFALSGSKWPGDTAVAAAASSGCATRLTGYLNPQLAISLSQAYVYPDSVAWQAGTRTVICEVRASSGELTGSVQGASATAG